MLDGDDNAALLMYHDHEKLLSRPRLAKFHLVGIMISELTPNCVLYKASLTAIPKVVGIPYASVMTLLGEGRAP
jgi:hypothetical protein